MCLILFAFQNHPEYPLLVAANRDEFHHRQTSAAHWWPDAPQLLAGKDLEAGGTWMGINRSGRFAAVTNVREPQAAKTYQRSRGLLPKCYLQDEIEDEEFCRRLRQGGQDYAGFNLLFGSSQQLYYHSNRLSEPQRLPPGLYGLSNAQLDTPWPKVERGKQQLQQLLAQPKLNSEQLLGILTDTAIASDEQLPTTGVPIAWERMLSAIRIVGPEYGTRSSTALLVGRQQVELHERTLLPQQEDARFRFPLLSDKRKAAPQAAAFHPNSANDSAGN